MAGVPGLFSGFDHEAVQQHLAIGDIVCLLADGRNGIVAAHSTTHTGVYRETQSPNAWVEILPDASQMPENIANCCFRLTPRLQYAEREALQHLEKTLLGGPRKGPSERGGSERVSRPPTSAAVKDGSYDGMQAERARQKQLLDEEIENNVAEVRQREGEKLHYGDCVQLQHVQSGLFLTILKERSKERGHKKVGLQEGMEASVFVIEPAFKTYSSGDEVSNGGQVVFRSFAKIGGQYRSLSMSRGTAPKVAATWLTNAAMELQIDPRCLRTVEEVNANAEAEAINIWRPLLSSSWNQRTAQKKWLKAEDIVCFYHKEAEMFLDYDPFTASDRPQLKHSRRVSTKDRKKSSWLWKVESVNIQWSSDQVHCLEGKQYRIRHVISGRYLIIQEDELTVLDYSQISENNTNSLFSFKQFDKRVSGTHLEHWSLAYIRNAFQPTWVTENTWLSRWLKEMASETASGLVWECVGASRPNWGRELKNAELAQCLRKFDKFRIDDLHVDTYVQVDESFFKPAAASHFTDEERHLLHKVFHMSCATARALRQSAANSTWDIFISYRQESDMNLVQLLYHNLRGLMVVENGVERQLRIFWDRKGLETGKKWQDSFVHAISNSSLIISVLSAGTFTKIHKLQAESPCDNVVLEQEIALMLQESGKATVLPLLVGNITEVDGVGEMYTDFFNDKCIGDAPLPDIRVWEIDHKVNSILQEDTYRHNSRLRTVKEVFDGIFELQGVKLKGDKMAALEQAVQSIYECHKQCMQITRQEAGKLFLDKEELTSALSRLGWAASAAEVEKLLKNFDVNGDGVIDEDEFEALLVWLKRNMSRILRQSDSTATGDKENGVAPSEIGIVRQENGAPQRDAFLIVPVQDVAIRQVVKVRDHLNVLKYFEGLLIASKPHGRSGESGSPEPDTLGSGGGVMACSKSQALIALVSAQYDVLVNAISSMLLELTIDDDDDALSREGVPSKLVQKLVREGGGLECAVNILEILTSEERGIDINLIAHDKKLSGIQDLATYLYRFLKQTIKDNITNCKRLYPFSNIILSHLGKGLSTMPVLKEMFVEKSVLIDRLTKEQIEKIVSLLDEIRDPRYIDFLLSICTCDSKAVTKVQGYITEMLLIQKKHHLPKFKIVGSTLHVSIDEHAKSQVSTEDIGWDDGEWFDLSSFKRQVERGGKWRDYAGEVMSKPFTSLQPREKRFRYFVRCTNLFGKLVFGRNQTALRALLYNETMCLSYDNVLQIMSMTSLPLLVRARFTTLMQHLYVDRDPNVQKPFILYTRCLQIVLFGRLRNIDINACASFVESRSYLSMLCAINDGNQIDFNDAYRKLFNA